MLQCRRLVPPAALVLAAMSFALPACESSSVVDPDAGTLLRIEAGPELLRPAWRLSGPDATTITGRGDTLLTALAAGEYLLLWEPQPGFHSPPVNPVDASLSGGTELRISGWWVPIEADPGTITIDARSAGIDLPWNLYGPADFFAAGAGPRVLSGRAPGEYTIVWAATAGQARPPHQTARLDPGAELVLRASDPPALPDGGSVEIDPNPDLIDATWELTLPGGDVISARGDTVLAGLPPGPLTLRWGAVFGFFTPAPQAAVLDPYSTLRFATTYLTPLHQIGTISIEVVPASARAPWLLASDSGYLTNSAGDSTLTGLPASRYVVMWGPVEGYDAPPPVLTSLTPGDVVYLTGQYTRADATFGRIHVDPNPDSIAAPWQLVSDSGVVHTGFGDSTLVDQEPGTWTLTWGAVQGFLTPTPNPVVRTLDPGGVLGFTLQ